jgi:transcriptional regulator with XRE-family HTH domain
MKVKHIRESLNMSQEDLAKKAGVAQSTIHYIECGNNPTFKTLKKLAAALGISVTELLDEPKTGAEN